MLGIPYLHPVLVHFPVAFLLLAAFTAFAWLIRGKTFWRQATALLLAAGVLGGFAAYYTGDDVAEAFKDKPSVKALVEQHEDGALWTMIFGCAALAGFIAAEISSRDKERKGLDGPDRKLRLRALLFVLAFAAAVLVGYTGHLGGTMVWGSAPARPAPDSGMK